MRIVTVIGARPQFIKAAVVSREIAKTPGINELIVHTGQHYDANMSDVFFEEMQIPKPHYHLAVGGGTHGAMTGQMLEKIEDVLIKEKPDAVLVYGDTNSTLAGALAAAKLHIPVAHVEAGLRSFNMKMPEEVNRILTDRISQWLFCPTDTAIKNLSKEGFPKGSQNPMVTNVGDVMYDAALFYQKHAKPTEDVAALIDDLRNGYYLSTIHRAENTDNPQRIQSIFRALLEICKSMPVVLPLHPRTRKIIELSGCELVSKTGQLFIIDPVGYFDMITLLSNCRGVFTDSGGVQKEAYFFHKPCITLRDETEWVELVDHGLNTLVGANRERIIAAAQEIKNRNPDYSLALYGTGNAGSSIVNLLMSGIN